MAITLLAISFWGKLGSWLNYWDTWLFLKVNTVWTNSLLDSIFPWWREASSWIPLYLFLLVFGILNFPKKVLPWLLGIAITITLSDQLSSKLVKNWIARPRPCQEGYLAGHIRLLLDSCGSGFSFTSSHATNHFALAFFFYLTLKPIFKKWSPLFFIWAATISYGQVYVGVHYPLDVIGGGLIGSGIGYFAGSIFNKRVGLLNQDMNLVT